MTPVASAARPADAAGGLRQVAGDLLALTKPKVQLLLLLTTVTTMLVAGSPSVGLVLVTLLGGYLSAGGAGAVNHWYDRDIDARMARTADRPVPSGRVAPGVALAFGLALGAASFALLWVAVNLLAALLALSGFVGYTLVYTVWLKRRTPQNIVIGGAAGAVPPLVGWAAVTGEVGGTALYLFAIVFFWTPPHFWALSLLMKDEYARVGVPMLPVVRGERETRRQVLLYSVLLYGVTQLPFCAGAFGPLYLAACPARAPRRPPRGPAALPLLAAVPRAALRGHGRRRAAVARSRRAAGAAGPPARRAPSHRPRRLGFAAHGPAPRQEEPPLRADRRRRLHGHVRRDLPRGDHLHRMSPVERPAPPAGEEIHLPGGSLQPLLLCVGVTTALLGVTASVWLVVLGSLLAVVTLVLWIRDVRSDVQHLPAQHESHSV